MKTPFAMEALEHITDRELDKIKQDIVSDCCILHTKQYHAMLTGQLMTMFLYGFISYKEYTELKEAMAEKEEK